MHFQKGRAKFLEMRSTARRWRLKIVLNRNAPITKSEHTAPSVILPRYSRLFNFFRRKPNVALYFQSYKRGSVENTYSGKILVESNSLSRSRADSNVKIATFPLSSA
jgi:hypothetical protein